MLSTITCISCKVKYFWNKLIGLSNSYSWGVFYEIFNMRLFFNIFRRYQIIFIHKILHKSIFPDLIFLFLFLNRLLFLTVLDIRISHRINCTGCNNIFNFESLGISIIFSKHFSGCISFVMSLSSISGNVSDACFRFTFIPFCFIPFWDHKHQKSYGK